MHTLHITNDYSGSTVYMNLIKELDNLGIEQIVYTPVKSADRIDRNKVGLSTEKSRIIYSYILNLTWDRLFYRKKIEKILRDIESKVNMSQISIIHAHTWYSDGGVAYLLSKKYNIPYIVAVRSSDITVFYKYLLHQRAFGRQILERSKQVIAISAAYLPVIQNLKALSSISDSLKNKLQVLANGVNSFWIDNSIEKKKKLDYNNHTNIIYIGQFIKRKKITQLQEAVIKLNHSKNTNVKLHIVGGGGDCHDEVINNISDYPDFFEYHGKVFDKEKLKNIINSCDIFAMPSSSETFGLVYVEALLQGLPILYTKGEGIDGFYDENIGEKVSKSASVGEIKEKLDIMITNIDSYVIPTELIKKNHDWRLIAKTYENIYLKFANK